MNSGTGKIARDLPAEVGKEANIVVTVTGGVDRDKRIQSVIFFIEFGEPALKQGLAVCASGHVPEFTPRECSAPAAQVLVYVPDNRWRDRLEESRNRQVHRQSLPSAE